MKQIFKRLTALTCACAAAATMLAFTACDNQPQIINAYDIAVKNGFQGDEAAWLQSLHGKNGEDGKSLDIVEMYEASGFEGSLLDFIKELGVEFTLQEDNATCIIAENITSVLNVCCAFTKDVVVGNRWNSRQETAVSAAEGSAVIVDIQEERGVMYAITNYHVVYDADKGVSDCIWLYPYGARESFTTGDTDGDGYTETAPGNTQDGDGVEAHFIGGAMDYDIALLQINNANLANFVDNYALRAANFGDSEEVTVGEKVFAIGNSNGFGISVTNGVISVDSENITMTSTDGQRAVSYRVMRTDAAINHGNSGGGLFNAQGELIGITNAKSVADETDNMGYALPITQVKYALQNIWNNISASSAGFILRAWLGVETYIDSTKTELVDGKLKITETFLVSKVLDGEDGGAAAGRLKVGDIFKSVTLHGKTTVLTRRHQLNDILLTVEKGDTMIIDVVGEDGARQVSITFDKDAYFVKYA